ncbi:MAG: addiction module antitoxin [Cyanobacteria bacterium P01_H01_bin.74]
MKRKLTITVSEDVYNGLQVVVGARKISQFLEELARPHVVRSSLEAGYREAAQDEAQETEALEWSDALIGDSFDGQPS